MKYACGVVLYHPDKENIDELIKLKPSFDLFLAYNNTEEMPDYQLRNVCDVFFSSNKNDGLAKSYNQFIEYCIECEIDVLCILDQDTMLSVENLMSIKKYIEYNYSNQVAIYAPRLKGSKRENWVINSNSFLNIPVLKRECLRYDEYYFIDRLDADFCMQIRKKQLSIDIIDDVVLDHKIGLGKKGEHTPMRHYYMFRNRIYYNHKFFPRYKAMVLTVLQDMRHIGVILKNESDKSAKLKAGVRGKIDYIRKHSGEYKNEKI